VSAGVALDAAGFVGNIPNAKLVRWPALVGHLRFGIAKRIELGLALDLPFGFVPSFSGTAKIQITAPGIVDLGLMNRFMLARSLVIGSPYGDGCGDSPYCKTGVLQLQGELIPLVGINVSSDMTLILAVGGRVIASPEQQLGYRLTAGFQWRITDAIAIHPEVTYMPNAVPLAGQNVEWFGGIAILGRGKDGYAKSTDSKDPPEPPEPPEPRNTPSEAPRNDSKIPRL
jgi:hypothetical protein